MLAKIRILVVVCLSITSMVLGAMVVQKLLEPEPVYLPTPKPVAKAKKKIAPSVKATAEQPAKKLVGPYDDMAWSFRYPDRGKFRHLRYQTEKKLPVFKAKWLAWKGGQRIEEQKLKDLAMAVVRRMPHVENSDNVIALLVETAIAESDGGRIIRNSYGDHGVFQIKEYVANDLVNWLKYTYPDIHEAVMAFYNKKLNMIDNLERNIPFAIAMCVSEYWRKAGANFTRYMNTPLERAVMWKSVYNTSQGLGTVNKYLSRIEKYVAEI